LLFSFLQLKTIEHAVARTKIFPGCILGVIPT
jgi:hypothetical protein